MHEDIKEFLELSDKLLVDKIEKISEIKKTEILNGKDPDVVFRELNPILNHYLYHLLLIVASGDEFISWSDYLMCEEEAEVEKEVWNKLYKNLYLIDNKCSPSGANKMQLLSFYSTHKLQIEKEGIPEAATKSYIPKVKKRVDANKVVKTETNEKKNVFCRGADTSKSAKKIPTTSLLSSQNIKPFLKSTKNFNETTK